MPAAVSKKINIGQKGLHLRLFGAGKGVEAADAHADAAAPDSAWLLVLGAGMRWGGQGRVKILTMAGFKALGDGFAASERAMAKKLRHRGPRVDRRRVGPLSGGGGAARG
jgi:hypothetical protein